MKNPSFTQLIHTKCWGSLIFTLVLATLFGAFIHAHGLRFSVLIISLVLITWVVRLCAETARLPLLLAVTCLAFGVAEALVCWALVAPQDLHKVLLYFSCMTAIVSGLVTVFHGRFVSERLWRYHKYLQVYCGAGFSGLACIGVQQWLGFPVLHDQVVPFQYMIGLAPTIFPPEQYLASYFLQAGAALIGITIGAAYGLGWTKNINFIENR